MDEIGPELYRQLVAASRLQDSPAHVPRRAFRQRSKITNYKFKIARAHRTGNAVIRGPQAKASFRAKKNKKIL